MQNVGVDTYKSLSNSTQKNREGTIVYNIGIENVQS